MRILTILTLSLLIFSTHLAAQQSRNFGDFEVHYNVINAHLIPPEVASAYGIQRASSQVLLNITVMRGDPETGEPRPVHARVQASATNLSAQRRDLRMREVDDRDAVYYIGQMRVRNEEVFDFDIQVRPQGHDGSPFTIQFRQQFFTDQSQ